MGGLRGKTKKARDQVTCAVKLELENLHYIIINHISSTTVRHSPAGISPQLHHELDFASLTLWTRLRVVHRGLDLASTSRFRLSVDLVRTSISDSNVPANAHIDNN